MSDMERLIAHIRAKYAPLALIVYGSYADGTNGPDSDFDALAIVRDGEAAHDVSVAEGVVLDLFVYPEADIRGEIDSGEFVQVADGQVVLDEGGLGQALKKRVLAYIEAQPKKTAEEIAASLAWCDKMLQRARRGDAEGMFRHHWLLTESLEIYCDAAGRFYRGPKKTLRWLEKERPQDFACCMEALSGMEHESLAAWVACIRRAANP